MAFNYLAAKYLATGFSAFTLSISGAFAAHTDVAACGGASINQTGGIRDGKVISRSAERQIEQFLQQVDALPGASIAIVKGNKVVYARGYGFRDLDGCQKATPKTRFYLKSTTKNFLGAAAAVLHEEGAIELDAPIGEYLPDLQFPDGLNPQQTSIRAHLTHTQPYHDGGLNYRTAYPGNLSEEDFVDHASQFSSAKDIRFRYSNFGPIMGAHAIGAKTDTNWRNFIHDKVFEPSGMDDSFTVMAQAEQGEMAQGYLGALENAYKPISTKVDAQMHAAGGSVSTVLDLSRWLIINLNKGRIDGKQALPQRAIEQVHARQVQLDKTFGEYKRFAYGLGLYSADYDGDLVMHHFGGETHMSFMPERGLGIIILANELDFGGRVTHGLAASIYDILLHKADADERMAQRVTEISNKKTQFAGRLQQYLAMVKEKAPTSTPEYSTADIIGAFESERLGTMTIIDNAGALQVEYGVITGSLDHLGGDAYLADIGVWNSMPPQVFVFREDEERGFVLDWDGRIFERREKN